MFKRTKLKKKNNIIFSDGCFLFENSTNLMQKHKNQIYEQDFKNEQKIIYSKLTLNETLNVKKLNYRKKIFK